MSRKRPFRKLLMVLLTAAVPAFAVALCAVIESVRRWDRVSIPVGHSLSVAGTAKQKYDVEVITRDHVYPVKTFHGPIRATNAETVRVDRYSTILAPEFALYPPELIRRSLLKRIVLCRGLSYNGQYRAAVPDFEHDTLYLDVMAGDYSPDYQRRTIHHDFFHIIDYRDDGELYSDDQWARLNASNFRYGKGGAKMQDDPGSGLPWNEAGFVTRYATSAVEEDKAETFSHMMTEYALVVGRAETDSVIRAKLSFMKSLLNRFCSEIDDNYWEKLRVRTPPTGRVQLTGVAR